LTPVFEHTQPFWYYAPITLLGTLPWLPLLIVAVPDGWRSLRSKTFADSPSLFLACWAGFTFVFFSLSKSKLPGYILPAIPPAMLLVARSAARLAERKSASLRVAVASVGFLLPIGLGIAQWKLAFPATSNDFEAILGRGLQQGLLAALLFGSLIGWSALRGKWNQSLAGAACSVALLVLIANWLFLPAFDWFSSARPAAEIFMKHPAEMSREVVVYRLQRAYNYELDYYFQRELPEWSPKYPHDAYVFVSRNALAELSQEALLSPDGTVLATGDGNVVLAHINGREPDSR
jgi:4-amino-4-deoxy-L-arabinose transferase-like glycosyltransferase